MQPTQRAAGATSRVSTSRIHVMCVEDVITSFAVFPWRKGMEATCGASVAFRRLPYRQHHRSSKHLLAKAAAQPPPKKVRATQSVSTLAERVKILKWMDEADAQGTKHLFAATSRKFQSSFRRKHNANLTKLMPQERKSVVQHHPGGRKRVYIKAASGRGRKRSEWVTWLHKELLEDWSKIDLGIAAPEHDSSDSFGTAARGILACRTIPALAAIASACVVVAIVACADGRTLARQPPRRRNVFRFTVFKQALQCRRTAGFHKKLRCDRASFLAIAGIVRMHWRTNIHHNIKHSIMKRVALTMMYLAHVLDVLVSLAPHYIKMATTKDAIAQVTEGFNDIAGFPDTVGAMDCTLVRICRPSDYEGWYCRKNYLVVNVQAIVDHNGNFCSYSIRSGSCNDQSIWNNVKRLQII
ncbi:TPA: hypothetical protein N0F65_005479 [Lagenidium giganteum]|uniref:DDE Tnp4 domain-containing protein n=1 Tax=Lagenidium giganteum TaxID=4803 RepID=A0AAV2Z0H0_9STRA|nr:TPA: hypothetical protein N0F65_005479 [Lagenidium giganteum]